MSRWLLIAAAAVVAGAATAAEVERIEPAILVGWFERSALQLLVYGEDIAKLEPHIDAPGIALRDVGAYRQSELSVSRLGYRCRG